MSIASPMRQSTVPKRPSRRTLNVALLLGTLIVVGALAPAAWFWHRFQVNRISGAFLERAQELENDRNWMESANYLYRYVALHPEDGKARIQLAETYDRAAVYPPQKLQAIEFFYRATGLAPDRADLQVRLAELLQETGRTNDAQKRADSILRDHPQEPRALRVLAAVLQSRWRMKDPNAPIDVVLRATQAAVAVSPQNLELPMALAALYREDRTVPDFAKLADEAMDEMVARNADQAAAYLARYQYRAHYGLPEADPDLDRALELAPGDLNVLLNAAQRARGRKEFAEAQDLYQQAIAIAPKNASIYLGLCDVATAKDDVKLALETLDRGVKAADEDLRLHFRRAELLIADGQLDEAAEKIKQLDAFYEKRLASMSKPQLIALKNLIAAIRAEWHLAKGNSADAIPLLKRVVNLQGTSQEQNNLLDRAHSLQLLGGAYQAGKQWDQAASAFEQAALLKPESVALRLSAASSWISANRLELAQQNLEKALEIEDSPETWLTLATVQFDSQVPLPIDQRSWDGVEAALEHLKNLSDPEALPSSWRLALFEADYVMVQADGEAQRQEAIPKAFKILRQAERKYPSDAEFFGLLVSAYERLGHPAQADHALETFDRLRGRKTASYALHARLLAMRKQVEEAKQALRDGIQAVPAKDAAPLRYGLAQLSLREGHTRDAESQLVQIAKADPTNVQVLRELGDMAIQEKDFTKAQQWEEKLQALEGLEGTHWCFFRAQRLAAQAKSVDDANFMEAVNLQTRIEQQRPLWPPAQLLKGILCERQGKLEQAIEAYQAAIRLGENRLELYERLVGLLYKAQRFAEVDQYLTQLKNRAPLSNQLSSLAISAAAHEDRLDRALELAEEGAKQREDDPMAQIWLGQMLMMNQHNTEAEAAFRRAVELAPKDPRTWNGLFSFLVRAKKAEEAQKLLEQLDQETELPAAQRAFVLAQGYELLGRRDEAEGFYRQAAKADPDSPEIQMRLAAFLMQSDPAQAEEASRKAYQNAPESGNARRRLAAVLAARGAEKEWQEAQQLLRKSSGAEAIADERLLAELLSRRGGMGNFKRAREILTQLTGDAKTALPSDHLLLAQLYEAEGKLQLAREQLSPLVASAKSDITYLTAFIDLLLRQKDTTEADRWLKKLEEEAPLEFNTLRLRSLWLGLTGKPLEIAPHIEPYVEQYVLPLPDTNEKKRVLLSVGNLYTELKLTEDAERWYRRLVEAAPEMYEPLGLALTAQGRVREAIDLCTAAAKSDASTQPSVVAARILSSIRLEPAELELADKLFAQSLKKHPDDAELMFSIGTIRFLQRRNDEAERLYEQTLKLSPDHIAALNNLATLLSEKPERRQAGIELVDRAIKLVGRQAFLLDTRGTILVYEGKASEAVHILEEATLIQNPDPRYHFHLALAYDKVGDKKKAREALRRSRENDLASQYLTDLDQGLLKDLDAKLR